jgi:2-dehydropantoate 2-reductase
MKIAIIGSGGVGGYFGGSLARAGFDVTFLARGDHAAAMRDKGLTVKSVNGDFHVENVKVAGKISEIGETDLSIICVKAWQVKEIGKQLGPIVKKGSSVLPLQNGILAADELAESIERSAILGGLCRVISKIESPGVINHSAIAPTIIFGEFDKSSTPRLQEIKKCFNKAGITSRVSADIIADLWKKFIPICVSGLLAITRTTYGELREVKETRAMMVALIREVYNLAIAAGINIEADFPERSISFIDTFPRDATSSLTRDVWEGKPSEIEYQNGTVVKLGEKLGIDTPVNRFVYNCILPVELKARKALP